MLTCELYMQLQLHTAEMSDLLAVANRVRGPGPAKGSGRLLFVWMALGNTVQNVSCAACRDGPYMYYSRTEEGKQYRVHCRRRLADGAGPPSGEPLQDQTQPEAVPALQLTILCHHASLVSPCSSTCKLTIHAVNPAWLCP